MLEAVLLGLDASPGILSHSRIPTDPSSSRNTFNLKAQTKSPTRVVSSVNNEAEEELVWSGQTVTWSRGCQIYRQYSYGHDKEDIAYAVFTHFQRGTGQVAGRFTKGKGKEEDTALSQTFGPFHTAHTSRWGQSVPSTSAKGLQLERALMIFLQTKAYIYFPSGEEVIVHIPFVVEKAWPLSTGGVIVQRLLQKRELRRKKRQSGSVLRGMDLDMGSTSVLDNLVDLEDDGEDLPRVWALEKPLEEFKMVTEAGNGFSIPYSSELLLVGTEPGSPVVIYDTDRNQVVFYRRTTGTHSPKITQSPLTARTMRPEDVMRQPEPLPKAGRASLGRNPSTTVSRADRRQSGIADPLERTTRRAPRLSRTAGPDKDLPAGSATGELHAALDPPPFAVTVNQSARNGGRVVSGASSIGVDKSDRRGSGAFMREELPVVDKRGLFAIGEKDLRETTMLMGLDRPAQTLKSDITLERMTWDTPPPDATGITPTVFITENLWPVSICVNVQYPSEIACFKFTPDSCSLERRIGCKSAVPIISTRHGIHDLLILGDDGLMRIMTAGGREIQVNQPRRPNDTHDEVVRRMASSLSMQVDGDDSMGQRSRDRRIVGFRYPAGSRVTICYDDGETARVSFDFTIKDRLVQQCSEAFACVLAPPDYFIFQRELLTRLQAGLRVDPLSAWDILLTTLKDLLRMTRESVVSNDFNALLAKAQRSSRQSLRRLGRSIEFRDTLPQSRNPPVCGQILASELAPAILFALHMVAQNNRCLASTQADLLLLGPSCSKLAGSLGVVGWYDYWMRLVPSDGGSLAGKSVIDCSGLLVFETPPDVLQYFTSSLTHKTKPFPIPGQIKGNDLGDIHPFHNLEILCDIYSNLSGNTAGLALFKAHETIKKIHRRGLSPSWIQSLAPGVMVPILEALRICQNHPDNSWTPELYRFIGRGDIAAKTERVAADEVVPVDASEGQPTIGDLMAIAPTNVKRLPDVNLPHVRFGSDRRVAEVERILQTTRVRTISIGDPKGYSEQDILHYHQTVVNTIAIRTLAVLVGSGIFEYGTRRTTVTETWDVPPIELSVKVLPGNSVIKAQLVAENADWPCFHNGVSAALAISPDCKGIDSSWIVFNRPATLNPEHGGLLLGLGLNGHLRSLMAYHAFPYMEPRHDFTSCGLLLGLACSFAGSQDPLCTKVLSLHTHALLPLGSAELNASPIIQSSALLGLGLVHAGSRNLRMAEVALSEVGRNNLSGVELFEGYQESYSFSASMAFGLIMLGRGGKQSSEVDRRLLAKLRRCILGDPTDNTSNAIDTTMTSPGATLALGFMYLKTGQREIANMLEIPQSAFEADHVRPDILLLRVLARSLIMWDEINASLPWIEAQLPPFLQKGHSNHRKTSSMEIACELAYFNIIAGACLAIGLKLAGTGSELAHNNLLFFFGVLLKASCSSSMSYEGKIRRQAARQCLNVVTLALATVMSGTGELNVLRRLRVSHGQEGAGVTYGTHMATHMATGILFLGRGHYTLGNSNMAIAAMCISFFPRFQPSPSDNKAYPQAFRHLWALAAEPRCLMAKDVDTKETVYLPLRTKVQGPQGPYTQRLISPTLIQPYETILQISVDTPRYWPVGYDLTDPSDKEALVKTRTMYVKRRAAYLDYNTDPKGNRSMVITAGSISGLDHYYDLLAAAEPMSLPAADVEHIIKTHAGTPQLVAMIQLFCTDSKFDKFIRNVLIECVSMDKTNLIGIYISMWLGLHGQEDLKVENITQLSMIRDFYSPSVFTHFSMPADKRLGWIRPNFVTSASKKISDREISESTITEYFTNWQWTPVIAIYLHRNHVPSLEFLRVMKDLVQRSTDEAGALREKVRDAARAYATALQGQYRVNKAGGVGEIKLWKSESIDDALRVWQSIA